MLSKEERNAFVLLLNEHRKAAEAAGAGSGPAVYDQAIRTEKVPGGTSSMPHFAIYDAVTGRVIDTGVGGSDMHSLIHYSKAEAERTYVAWIAKQERARSGAKRWTKADVDRLTSTINTFFLINRPLTSSWGADTSGFDKKFTDALASQRMRIVLAGLHDNVNTAVRRKMDYAESAAHMTGELRERFTKMSLDEQKPIAMLRALIARVEREGLPAEVNAYDPRAR